MIGDQLPEPPAKPVLRFLPLNRFNTQLLNQPFVMLEQGRRKHVSKLLKQQQKPVASAAILWCHMSATASCPWTGPCGRTRAALTPRAWQCWERGAGRFWLQAACAPARSHQCRRGVDLAALPQPTVCPHCPGKDFTSADFQDKISHKRHI